MKGHLTWGSVAREHSHSLWLAGLLTVPVNSQEKSFD